MELHHRNMRGVVFLILCIIWRCYGNDEPIGPLATTISGTLVGKTIQVLDVKINAFLGVPFAEPPLADLRFRPPIPARRWDGVRPAHQKPSPCSQPVDKHFPWSPTTEPSEDCLYLNVWAPEHRDIALPVMVWFHSGGFAVGSSDMDVYDGNVLASYGNVVVVSANYRLGVLGFMNAGTDDAPGNAGMLDQVLALKWVRDNIANFGGDPEKVIIFGESAGGWSVSLHLVSPLSKGLFRRAIMQSGTMYHPQMVHCPKTAKQWAIEFAKLAECRENELVQCLKEKDAKDLVSLQGSLTKSDVPLFLPSHCNSFLPRPPMETYESDEWSSDVDVLLGVVKDEGTVFLPLMVPESFQEDRVPDFSMDKFEGAVKKLFRAYPDSVVEAMLDYYFKNATEFDSILDFPMRLADAFGDSFFNCPTVFLAEKVDGYVYWFTHRSDKEKLADWLGATHFSEVKYVFGGPVVDPDLHTLEDVKFSKDILKMWADFAHYGQPSKDDHDGWPKFSSAEPVARELHPRTPGPIRFPRFDVCDRLWRRLYHTTPVHQQTAKNEL